MAQNITQPKSFRITEETANRLKEIAQITGKNQQDTMAMLIQVYELQEGKEALSGKKDEIEKFEGLITSITRMYMNALEDGKDAMTIAKSQFEAQLYSKDQMILDLQKRCEELQNLVKLNQEEMETKDRNLLLIKKRNDELEEQERSKKEDYNRIIHTKEELLESRSSMLLRMQKENEIQLRKIEESASALKAVEAEKESLMLQLKANEQEREDLQSKNQSVSLYLQQLKDNFADMDNLYKIRYQEMEEDLKKKYQLQLEREVFQCRKEIEEEYSIKMAQDKKKIDSYKEKYYKMLEDAYQGK